MFETMLTPKSQRVLLGHSFDHAQMADLLVAKDKELRVCLHAAHEQEDVQKAMDKLRAEVDKQDDEIKQLQKHLKDAEHVLVRIAFAASMPEFRCPCPLIDHPISR